MNTFSKILAIGFAFFLALVIFFGIKNGVAFGEQLGTAMWLTLCVGFAGIFFQAVRGIYNMGSTATSVSTSFERYSNSFMIPAFIVGIIFEIQLLLAVCGSSTVFIPSWIETIIYIVNLVLVIIWIIFAIRYLLGLGIQHFRRQMSTGHRWLMFAGIFLGFVIIFLLFKYSPFSLDQGDGLFKPMETREASVNGLDAKTRLEKLARVMELAHEVKFSKNLSAKEKVAKMREIIAIWKECDTDGSHSEEIAAYEKLLADLEALEDSDSALADASMGDQSGTNVIVNQTSSEGGSEQEIWVNGKKVVSQTAGDPHADARNVQPNQ